MDHFIRHLNIEVTKRCNQYCFYCFNNSGRGARSKELQVDTWLTILSKLQRGGLESMHLTGGEPFVYAGAIQLLEGAQELGLNTSILSNGFRVSELCQTRSAIFQRLTVAQISLDSMDSEEHDRRRGYRGAWRDAVDAIHALRDLKVPVEVSCVATEADPVDLSALADFCAGIDASLILRSVISAGRAPSSQTPGTLACDLDHCLQSVIESHPVRLASDRFAYVADEHGLRPKEFPCGFETAHADGRLRFFSSDFSLLSLVA